MAAMAGHPEAFKWHERSETKNMFCKAFLHTLVFKDASTPFLQN